MSPDVDPFKRIDMRALYGPFAVTCRILLSNCIVRGESYIATSGLRTYEQQEKLYAKGRTEPGNIVTNAMGGYSLHNFGAAIDFCRDADAKKWGLQPDYNPAHYEILAQEAEKLGLESGLHWKSIKDAPHIQLPIAKHGIDLAELRREFVVGGYDQVFHRFDSVKWQWI